MAKWSNPGNGIVPSPTSRYSSYWKGSLLVINDQGRQLYFYIVIGPIHGSICNTFWTLMKHIEKQLYRDYTRILRAGLNKSWKQHLTKQQLKVTYIPSHKLSNTTREVKDVLKNGILPKTPSDWHTSVVRPARIITAGFSLDVLHGGMGDKDRWQGGGSLDFVPRVPPDENDDDGSNRSV